MVRSCNETWMAREARRNGADGVTKNKTVLHERPSLFFPRQSCSACCRISTSRLLSIDQELRRSRGATAALVCFFDEVTVLHQFGGHELRSQHAELAAKGTAPDGGAGCLHPRYTLHTSRFAGSAFMTCSEVAGSLSGARWVQPTRCYRTRVCLATVRLLVSVNELVVVGVTANPEPQHPALYFDRKRPVMQADTGGPVSPNFFEM